MCEGLRIVYFRDYDFLGLSSLLYSNFFLSFSHFFKLGPEPDAWEFADLPVVSFKPIAAVLILEERHNGSKILELPEQSLILAPALD